MREEIRKNKKCKVGTKKESKLQENFKKQQRERERERLEARKEKEQDEAERRQREGA